MPWQTQPLAFKNQISLLFVFFCSTAKSHGSFKNSLTFTLLDITKTLFQAQIVAAFLTSPVFTFSHPPTWTLYFSEIETLSVSQTCCMCSSLWASLYPPLPGMSFLMCPLSLPEPFQFYSCFWVASLNWSTVLTSLLTTIHRFRPELWGCMIT